jgi:hypothetical protein
MRIFREDLSLAKVESMARSLKGKQLTPEERSILKKLTERLAEQEKILRELRAQLDAVTDGNVPTSLQKKFSKALTEHYQAKRDLQKDIEKFRIKTWADRARDIASLPRTLITTADLGATLRQGLLLSARRPMMAAGAFVRSVKAAFNQHTADEIYVALKNRPLAEEGEKAGLYLTPLDRIDAAAREEAFSTSLAEEIPGYRHVVLGSERHMVTHLNILRAAAFDGFVQNHPHSTQEDRKAFAKYVNAASGRGSLGDFESASRNLSFIFFSARFMVSRFQAPLSLATNWNNPVVRNEIAKDFGAMLGTGSVVLFLAALAGADVGLDPEKSDFGKIIIGNTRIDLWAGFQQPARLVMLYGLKGLDTAGFDVLSRDVDLVYSTMKFGQYKLAPSITIPIELIQGKNAIGQEVTPLQTISRNALPLFVQDSWEVITSDNPERAAVTVPLSILGAGVSVYD